MGEDADLAEDAKGETSAGGSETGFVEESGVVTESGDDGVCGWGFGCCEAVRGVGEERCGESDSSASRSSTDVQLPPGFVFVALDTTPYVPGRTLLTTVSHRFNRVRLDERV